MCAALKAKILVTLADRRRGILREAERCLTAPVMTGGDGRKAEA
jgi:hypothetical protein